VLLDNTDRNRTSPFAFTGNKFEFRAVGSTANCAVPMMVLNSIMADQLRAFKVAVDARIDSGDGKDEAILKELQILIKGSKRIRFEGNGYGEAWVKEAADRGLSNLMDTPAALAVWGRKEVVDLFESLNVLTAEELEARTEVDFETYIMHLQIEARVLINMVNTQIIPAVVDCQSDLLANIEGFLSVFGDSEGEKMAFPQHEVVQDLSEALNSIHQDVKALQAAKQEANSASNSVAQAQLYASKVRPIMDVIRVSADRLEGLCEDGRWPFPKLREILFTR
jgi:glutamine synthetase